MKEKTWLILAVAVVIVLYFLLPQREGYWIRPECRGNVCNYGQPRIYCDRKTIYTVPWGYYSP